MKRRSFLKFLAAGAVAATGVGSLKKKEKYVYCSVFKTTSNITINVDEVKNHCFKVIDE